MKQAPAERAEALRQQAADTARRELHQGCCTPGWGDRRGYNARDFVPLHRVFLAGGRS
jgi:hypothetical protein